MIVNYELKKCFIHLPKSGGTSITQRLLNEKGWENLGDAHDRTYLFTEIKDFEFIAVIREPDNWYKSMYSYSMLTGLPEREMFLKAFGVPYLIQTIRLLWNSKFSIWQKNAELMKWSFTDKLFNYTATFDLLRHSSYDVGWYSNRLKYQLEGLKNITLYKYENINIVFDEYGIDPLITNKTTIKLRLFNYKSDLSRDKYAVELYNKSI